MYKISLFNGAEKVILHHYSESEGAPKVINAKGKFGLNSVPSITIDVPAVHRAFNEFQEFKSHILVEDDKGNEVFYGRMINPSDSFNTGLSKLLIFEGELAYLNDSTIRPREWHNYSVKNFLREVLEEHNSQVEDYKKIYVGNVTVTSNLYRMSNYDKTLPFLLDRLPKRLGGFFVLRKVNGIKYLDYLLDTGSISKQAIIFGENMLDFQIDYDTTGIYTKLIPLGADMNDGTQDSKVGNRLNIKDINSGKDYIINNEAVSAYGLIETSNNWDDVTNAENLKRKGEAYLKEISKAKRSLKMKVADMYEINNTYEKYNLGDEIPVECKVFGVNEGFRIIEISLDLLNPMNNTYLFGNKIGTLTDKQIIMQNSQAKIESFFNENGLKSQYLEGTINLLSNNMRAMVDNADKHDGVAILFECLIPGDLYGATAIGTKGFMIAEELKADGTWNWRTFGTAKGFVADLIIAGTMLADRIRGGILESMDGSLRLDLTDTKNGIQFMKNGLRAININGNQLDFFDWDGLGEAIAKIYSTRFSSDEFKTGLAIANRKGSALSLAYEIEDGKYKSYITFDKDDILHEEAIQVNESVSFKNNTKFKEIEVLNFIKTLGLQSEDDIDNKLFRAVNAWVANKDLKSNRSISAVKDVIAGGKFKGELETNGYVKCYGLQGTDGDDNKLFGQNNSWIANKSFKVNENFAVVGTKNCIQETEHYGERLFYATEDCEPLFTDTGVSYTKSVENRYESIILLDNIYKESVDLTDYYVFLTKYGRGDIWVSEKTQDYFIIASEFPIKFNWKIEAKRKGYENDRLEEYINVLPNEEIINNEKDLVETPLDKLGGLMHE
ncbi:MAG: phage tail protein [Bacilli bacterium]